MKSGVTKWIEILVESVNYIIISYALSNMALVFQQHLLFILFFASEIWLMQVYWRSVFEKTKNKLLSAGLLGGCFVVHIGLTYYVGRIVGQMVPFAS